ncbi:MAG: hypothetical protein RL095_1320 [Verrucomicrobiota bacterium]|jgi:nitrate/TMAO reductase-like tetraheme cytochrome c subunit
MTLLAAILLLAAPSPDAEAASPAAAAAAHARLYTEKNFPSSQDCAACHQRQYEQWRGSAHAQASLSPLFQLAGRFAAHQGLEAVQSCSGCHLPAGRAAGLSALQAAEELPQSARDGVGCIACHRVGEAFGRVNGERRLIPGGMFSAVFGPHDGTALHEVLGEAQKYGVARSDAEPGRKVHLETVAFAPIRESDFCATCHQAELAPGLLHADTWSSHLRSPARAQGISCQDCHMGSEAGRPSLRPLGASAMVDAKILNPGRRCSDHSFNSAGASVLHPGLFPAHRNSALFTPAEWQLFDWRASWGRIDVEADFEDSPASVRRLPREWRSSRQRIDAATVIDSNLKARSAARLRRKNLLENGLKLGELRSRRKGETLAVDISAEAHPGHAFPAGSYWSAAETWAELALIGDDGTCLWRSGGLDPQGRIEPDQLQAFHPEYFLPAGAKAMPGRLRPSDSPAALAPWHSPLLKLDRRLAPGARRQLSWSLPADRIPAGGATLLFRMRSRAVPPQLASALGAEPPLAAAYGAEIDDFGQRQLRIGAQP